MKSSRHLLGCSQGGQNRSGTQGRGIRFSRAQVSSGASGCVVPPRCVRLRGHYRPQFSDPLAHLTPDNAVSSSLYVPPPAPRPRAVVPGQDFAGEVLGSSLCAPPPAPRPRAVAPGPDFAGEGGRSATMSYNYLSHKTCVARSFCRTTSYMCRTALCVEMCRTATYPVVVAQLATRWTQNYGARFDHVEWRADRRRNFSLLLRSAIFSVTALPAGEDRSPLFLEKTRTGDPLEQRRAAKEAAVRSPKTKTVAEPSTRRPEGASTASSRRPEGANTWTNGLGSISRAGGIRPTGLIPPTRLVLLPRPSRTGTTWCNIPLVHPTGDLIVLGRVVPTGKTLLVLGTSKLKNQCRVVLFHGRGGVAAVYTLTQYDHVGQVQCGHGRGRGICSITWCSVVHGIIIRRYH